MEEPRKRAHGAWCGRLAHGRGKRGAASALTPPPWHTGDVGEALASYSKAIVLDGEYVEAYTSRAAAAAAAGDMQQAVTDYTRAIELRPHDHSLYNRRGSVFEDMGDEQRAQQDYMKAVEIIS